MYRGNIDLPTFTYFDFGNVWTGSLLGTFNYRIDPQSKAEPPKLSVSVWYQRVIARLNGLIDEYRVKANAPA